MTIESTSVPRNTIVLPGEPPSQPRQKESVMRPTFGTSLNVRDMLDVSQARFGSPLLSRGRGGRGKTEHEERVLTSVSSFPLDAILTTSRWRSGCPRPDVPPATCCARRAACCTHTAPDVFPTMSSVHYTA